MERATEPRQPIAGALAVPLPLQAKRSKIGVHVGDVLPLDKESVRSLVHEVARVEWPRSHRERALGFGAALGVERDRRRKRQ